MACIGRKVPSLNVAILPSKLVTKSLWLLAPPTSACSNTNHVGARASTKTSEVRLWPDGTVQYGTWYEDQPVLEYSSGSPNTLVLQELQKIKNCENDFLSHYLILGGAP